MNRLGLLLITFATLACPARAADLHVDPVSGSETEDGVARPVKTIARAIRLAQPGDTIHLKPMVYRDWAAFFDKSGEPGRPITLEGHGATLEGCDPLDPAGWEGVSPGLYRHDDLLPLTDAIIDRWFFLWDGKLNRMSRCSKGPSEPLKSPANLRPGEWTFVKDPVRTKAARAGYINGSFFLRLPAGQSLTDAKIQIPYRPAGVLIHGKSRHLVIRNLTSTHPYNDGFNLSDCRAIVFENIRAVDCGDDGISAHGDCLYRVDGFNSIGNATGICDTGSSETAYRRVFIRDCIGFDLYFLDTGRYALTDSFIRSSATRTLYLQGRDKPAAPCCLTLDNVLIQRERTVDEIRVSANCRLSARSATFLNLDLQATGGDIDFERCLIGGTVPSAPPRKPRLHLWKEASWHGRGNWYDVDEIRIDRTSFRADDFTKLRQLTLSDQESLWPPPNPSAISNNGVGAIPERLPQLEAVLH